MSTAVPAPVPVPGMAIAAAASSAVAPMSAPHLVDADHTAHHVALDVAVVQPRAGGVLAPADAEALRRADGLGVHRPAVDAPAVPVHVEGVEVLAHRDHVPLDEIADARLKGRGVPDEGAAVDRHEAVDGFEVDDELAVRQLLA